MPDEGGVSEADTAPEGGTILEEGLRVKLAEGFVRNPVDAAVPVG